MMGIIWSTPLWQDETTAGNEVRTICDISLEKDLDYNNSEYLRPPKFHDTEPPALETLHQNKGPKQHNPNIRAPP